MSIFAGFFDDAAVFPPGSKPLPQAVPDHLGHRSAGYGDLVGPLVLAAPASPISASSCASRWRSR